MQKTRPDPPTIFALERLKELSGQAFGDNGPGKLALDPKDVKPPSRVTPN
jgi:hypothetical protein